MPQVWKWSPLKRKVLDDLFLGELSQAKTAEKHGISLNTLETWIRQTEFRAALQAKRQELEQSLFEQDIPYVTKEQRIVALARMAVSARAEYEAHPLLREIRPLPVFVRAKKSEGDDRKKSEDDDGQKKPEGNDGQQPASINDMPCIVNEAFNAAAFNAFRGALDDIAKEQGHRKQQVEHSGELDVTTRTVIALPEVEPDDDPITEDSEA